MSKNTTEQALRTTEEQIAALKEERDSLKRELEEYTATPAVEVGDTVVSTKKCEECDSYDPMYYPKKAGALGIVVAVDEDGVALWVHWVNGLEDSDSRSAYRPVGYELQTRPCSAVWSRLMEKGTKFVDA